MFPRDESAMPPFKIRDDAPPAPFVLVSAIGVEVLRIDPNAELLKAIDVNELLVHIVREQSKRAALSNRA